MKTAEELNAFKDGNIKELSDEHLETVTGRGISWKAFGLSILKAMKKSNDTLEKYKEFEEEIKRKNWLKIAEMAMPLLYEGDPVIIEAYKMANK